MPQEGKNIKSVIEAHESTGKYFEVEGIKTFARVEGRGEPVLCVHGVPTSSFLYRKVLGSLAKKGYKGICIDLPGFGLSSRPKDFDYSFSNYADFLYKAAKVLKLKKFHLVVHDIGGPVGFALAARHSNRIMSLTILNTWADVVEYKKPAVMRPFSKKVVGETELKMMTHLTWPAMWYGIGVEKAAKIPTEEMNAYVDLLKREDNGKAFLKVMRNYDRSAEFRDLCLRALQGVTYPIQAVWGEKDPTLEIETYGRKIQESAGLKEIHRLPAKHFLQEEAWLAIADKIVDIAQSNQLKSTKKEA